MDKRFEINWKEDCAFTILIINSWGDLFFLIWHVFFATSAQHFFLFPLSQVADYTKHQPFVVLNLYNNEHGCRIWLDKGHDPFLGSSSCFSALRVFRSQRGNFYILIFYLLFFREFFFFLTLSRLYILFFMITLSVICSRRSSSSQICIVP